MDWWPGSARDAEGGVRYSSPFFFFGMNKVSPIRILKGAEGKKPSSERGTIRCQGCTHFPEMLPPTSNELPLSRSPHMVGVVDDRGGNSRCVNLNTQIKAGPNQIRSRMNLTQQNLIRIRDLIRLDRDAIDMVTKDHHV